MTENIQAVLQVKCSYLTSLSTVQVQQIYLIYQSVNHLNITNTGDHTDTHMFSLLHNSYWSKLTLETLSDDDDGLSDKVTVFSRDNFSQGRWREALYSQGQAGCGSVGRAKRRITENSTQKLVFDLLLHVRNAWIFSIHQLLDYLLLKEVLENKQTHANIQIWAICFNPKRKLRLPYLLLFVIQTCCTELISYKQITSNQII